MRGYKSTSLHKSCSLTLVSFLSNSSGYPRARPAHEIAHCIGQRHALSVANNICGGTEATALVYPIETISGHTLVPMGKFLPKEEALFGWDDSLTQVRDPKIGSWELMSYCGS